MTDLYKPRKFIISRTDSIGDVILTLPVAGVLKQLFPQSIIIFLGSEYTRAVVNQCKYVDHFESINALLTFQESDRIKKIKDWGVDCIIHAFPRIDIARWAKKAGIKQRIGASGRWYHYLYCNHIVPLTRKRSELHEAQLNLKLTRGLGAKSLYSLNEIKELFGFEAKYEDSNKFSGLIKKDRFNLILHPKSKGSAREWGLENFRKLIYMLPQEQFNIFITGTEKEGELIKKEKPLFFEGTKDMTGKLTLEELIGFIGTADGLIAASTGPLHLAAALGKIAIGLYPPIRPMHPGRWAPIGKRAVALVKDINCSKCRNSTSCKCLTDISPETVLNKLLQLKKDD